ACIPETATRQMEDLDRHLVLLIAGDSHDLTIHGIAEMVLGLVIARIEQKPPLPSQIVAWPHGSGPFIAERELIFLPSCLSVCEVSPTRTILAPLVAMLAGRIEVEPFVGEPVVARMVGTFGNPALGPEVFHVPIRRSGDLRFAVGALPVEELLESGLHPVVRIDSRIHLSRFGRARLRLLEPGVIRPDRPALLVRAVPIDVDHGPELTGGACR